MSPASTHSKNKIQAATFPIQLGTSSSISATPSAVTIQFVSTSPIQERIRDMRRRNAISLAAGQTSATVSSIPAASQELAVSRDTVMANVTTSPARAIKILQSEDIIMDDAAAMPLAPNCKPDQTLVQGPEQESELPPKSKKKVKEKEAKNRKGRIAGNSMFPNLSQPSAVELAESEDMSRYVIDAPALPDRDDDPESSSSRDKGKGKGPNSPPLITIPRVRVTSTPNKKPTSSSFAVKRIDASVKRRVANYTITHPPGWFDDLPPINGELFKDSPHIEYNMVLIHTAKCGVCRQYNRGTLFMCAACTVSICEGCADGKCDVDATKDATGKDATGEDDVVMTGEGEKEESRAEDTSARKLEWYHPYHEVFRGAYLEWKVDGSKEGFESTEGVVFKGSIGRPGGRKRKAT